MSLTLDRQADVDESDSELIIEPGIYVYEDATGKVHQLVISSEAMDYVRFARRYRSEQNLGKFLEFVCHWVDLRENKKMKSEEPSSTPLRRDEILSNLWLWARLEHAANPNELHRIFHHRIADELHEAPKRIVHANWAEANAYLKCKGKRESPTSRAWRL